MIAARCCGERAARRSGFVWSELPPEFGLDPQLYPECHRPPPTRRAPTPARRDHAAVVTLRRPPRPLQRAPRARAPDETATLHAGCSAEFLKESVEPLWFS